MNKVHEDDGAARELELTLMMSDLCGYTALTEMHGALQASETVLRFVGLVQASLQTGVRIVDSIGDSVFCAGEDTQAVIRSALRLRDLAGAESGFPRLSTGLHRGVVVERAGRLFGAPINLTARLTARATGDQILCSAQIAQAVACCDDLECRLLGEQSFKNVTRPVPVFELAQKGAPRELEYVDPVCRMQLSADSAVASVLHAGTTYRFCSIECAQAFKASPELYGASQVRPAG